MSLNLTYELNLLAYGMLVSWLLISIPHVSRNRSSILKLIAAIVILAIVRFLPIYKSVSLAYVLFGSFGTISTATFLLLLYFNLGEIFRKESLYEIKPAAFIVILILALFLYLSVFGFLHMDIYSWGYYPGGHMMILFIVVMIILSRVSRLFTFLWLAALISFTLKFQHSINLWDYLFDIVMVIIAVIFLIVNGILLILNLKQTKPCGEKRIKLMKIKTLQLAFLVFSMTCFINADNLVNENDDSDPEDALSVMKEYSDSQKSFVPQDFLDDPFFTTASSSNVTVNADLASASYPKMHYEKTPEAYIIIFETPGIKKDNLSVATDGNYLLVSGKASSVIASSNSDSTYKKLSARDFTRRLPLHPDSIKSEISSRYDDGVLYITVPRDKNAVQNTVKKEEIE